MPELTIERLAPDPSAARAVSVFQERGLAYSVEGGLSLGEHIASVLTFDFPLSDSAEIPTDVQQAVKFVSGASSEDARSFR